MGNRITVYAMLQNVISKLGLREVNDLPFRDIMSWMVEALAHIGSLNALEQTSMKIPISNYMGRYPKDMHALISVKDYDYKEIRGGFQVPVTDTEVEVIYDRFPIDGKGYPLFPGDQPTKEAVLWYVAQFLAIQGLIPNGRLSPQYCTGRWNWYCRQARAEGFIPTVQQWDKMVNSFYSWMPPVRNMEEVFTVSGSQPGFLTEDTEDVD